MQEILLLQPLFKDRIWGGTKLNSVFGYHLESDHVGECWAISAHKGDENLIMNGDLSGKKLGEVYRQYSELFNDCPSQEFPLLTKIIDAAADLSIQVHPDDTYASLHASDSGKTECWYVLDAPKGTKMVFGHTAKDKTEFVKLVEAGKWDQLLIRKDVRKGDFIYVPSGTIHALCKGTMVLETQQSSDVTYRLYDYGRLDVSGKPRELHIESSIAVAQIPHINPSFEAQKSILNGNVFEKLIQTDHFSVERWKIKSAVSILNDRFRLLSVIEGSGTINETPVTKGSHLIVTAIAESIRIKGKMELILSYL
jgi:mannose-6-phosphate isomerase